MCIGKDCSLEDHYTIFGIHHVRETAVGPLRKYLNRRTAEYPLLRYYSVVPPPLIDDRRHVRENRADDETRSKTKIAPRWGIVIGIY